MPTEYFPILQVLKCIEDFKKRNADIKAFTEKWDTKLSTQQNGLQLYTFLEQKFNKEYKNANDKEFVKRIAIEEYSQHSNSDNAFISKGYAWFKRGKDLSLKGFLLFEFETAEDVRTGNKEYHVFDDSILKNETLIIPAWRKQEKRFNDAVKGWAYARFVDYVTKVTNIKAKSSISAPIIALFCKLVDDSKLLPQDFNETNEQFCKRICDIYNLEYTDRVRQNFSNKSTRKNKQGIQKQILPLVDTNTKNIIEAMLIMKANQH